MPNEKRSYNTGRLSVLSRHYLLPSRPKILLYIIIAALLLVIYNTQALWNQYRDSVLADNNATISQLASQSWAGRTFQSIFNGRPAQILFWALAGCVIYAVLWLAISIFSNIHNDIVADKFVHPTNYNRRRYWRAVLSQKAFLVAMVVVLLGFLSLCLKVVPTLGAYFLVAIQPFKLWVSTWHIAGTILGMAALLYIFVLLTHITINTWRTIYADL